MTTAASTNAAPGPRQDALALAWHDETCPEGPGCRDRTLHARSSSLVTSGVLHRFVSRLVAADGLWEAAPQVLTAAELDALPDGSVVIDADGRTVPKQDGVWWCLWFADPGTWSSPELLEETTAPLRLVHPTRA